MRKMFLRRFKTKKIFSGLFTLIGLLIFSGCEEILLEEDISSDEVVMLAPSDGVELKTTSVSFRWENLEGATSYRIQVASPNFNEPEQLLINQVTEDLEFSKELNVGAYEWRVQGLNSSYSTMFSAFSFQVVENEGFSNSQVVLLSPEDELITNKVDQLLKWKKIEGATIYRIRVEQDNQIIDEKVSTENELAISFPLGELTWKVRAENSTRNTLFSERTIFIDTLDPNKPNLISPDNEAVLDNPSVEFEWERENEEGSNELDSLYIFNDIGLNDLNIKDEVINSYSTQLERGETYYWYMKSFDEAGNQSGMSEVFSFSIN